MSNKKTTSFVVIGAIATGMLLLLTPLSKKILVPGYTVNRVIDGDTFETTEKQLFRLASLDAPELRYCGGVEAKKYLEKFVLGKTLYIKAVYLDTYRRNDSLVYTDEGSVNEAMLASGWASLNDRAQTKLSELYTASRQAIRDKRGIYSSQCTQLVNEAHPECTIKGNNPDRGGRNKWYHLPSCEHYTSVLMQLYLGDQWFCTEKEAIEAGYQKAGGCPQVSSK